MVKSEGFRLFNSLKSLNTLFCSLTALQGIRELYTPLGPPPPRQAEEACRELSEQVYFPRATREAEAERDREQEGAGRAWSAQHCSESRCAG